MRVFLIAGEASGDHLGAGLMAALRRGRPDIGFLGVGGPAMAAQGLASMFPLADIAVMGFLPVLARLPRLLGRIKMTAEAVVRERPDVLVLIDSPDFTHRVARRVRAAAAQIPIVDYVSPTVWAWRAGRAARMRGYVDHVLALLRSSQPPTRALAGRLAPMSAIRSSRRSPTWRRGRRILRGARRNRRCCSFSPARGRPRSNG